VLRLKAAKSFLETSQCTDFTDKSGLRDMKSRFYPVLVKIFIKKNVRNHSYHQFYPVLAKIRIN